MGFWNRVWNTAVDAARWVGNKVIKPVINTIKRVVNWVDRRVDDLYVGAKKVVQGTYNILDGFARMAGIDNDVRIYDTSQQQVRTQFHPDSMSYNETEDYLSSIKRKMIANHMANLQKISEDQEEELRVLQERHEKRMQEIARAQKQRESLEELIGIAEKIQSHAESVKSETRFQEFDQFARLRISMTFLGNLMDKLNASEGIDELSKDELLLLNNIDKFVFNQMENSEYKQFDELIDKFFGEDLLQIGSREILKDYRGDYNEKVKMWRNISSQCTKLRIEIKTLENKRKRLKDEGKLKELDVMIDEKRKEFSLLQEEEEILFTTKSIAEEYLFSLEAILNIASENIQLNERETQMVKGVAEIYLKYKNMGVSDFSFSEAEQKSIKEFNDLAMLNNWIASDSGMTDENEAEV